MNRHAAIEQEWADGTYTFRLGLGEIEELEENCELGIHQLFESVGPARTYRSKFITEIIRIGLIGGGLEPVAALKLVRKYCDERPIEESRDIAHAVVFQGLMRVHCDELISQAEASEDELGKSTTDASTSQESTGQQA